MSDFPITIDATPLYHESPILHHEQLSLARGGNAGTDWFLTKEIQHVLLEPDKYRFQIGSGLFAAFNFSVTAEGLVDYDTSFDNFIGGRGTSQLTLKGVEVSFDKSYLTSPILLLIELAWQSDPITTNTPVTLLPAEYSLIVGSGMRASFNFILNGDGTFALKDPAHEIEPDGSGGFLKGGGTNKLEFLGFPVLVDARAVVENVGVWLSENAIGPFPSGILFANLLPATFYEIRFKNDTSLPGVFFDLGLDGKISQSQPPPQLIVDRAATIQIKKFHNLTLLVIEG
jgi:hypothetical protein